MGRLFTGPQLGQEGSVCFCAFEPSLFQIGGEHFRRRWQLVVRPLEPRFGAVLRNTSVRAADSFDCRLRNTGAMMSRRCVTNERE